MKNNDGKDGFDSDSSSNLTESADSRHGGFSEPPQFAHEQKQKRELPSFFRLQMPLPFKLGLVFIIGALIAFGYIQSRVFNKPDVSRSQMVEGDSAMATTREPIGDFYLYEATGQKHKFSEYEGQVVILSFWASWCAPCLVELPAFAELQSKYGSRGFKIVTVNVDDGDEGPAVVKDLWAKKNFALAAYFDFPKELAQHFQVESLPANFVIDRQGRRVVSSYGSNDWRSVQAQDLIESLVNEKFDAEKSSFKGLTPFNASSEATAAHPQTQSPHADSSGEEAVDED